MAKYDLNLDGAEIDEISLNEHGDILHISADDASLFDRFTKGYDSIVKMAHEMPSKLESEEKKFDGKEDSDIEKAVAVSRVRVSFCEKAISIIDDIFGEETAKKSFRDAYETIPDFLPDDDMFVMFFEKMTPIMEDIFNRKIERQEKASKTQMSKYQPQDHNKHRKKAYAKAGMAVYSSIPEDKS